MGASKMMLGIVAGIACGAVLGVLMAPDSGENTRKKISSKSQEYADDIKSRFNTLVDNFTSAKEEVKDDLVAAKNKVVGEVTRKFNV